MTRTLAHTVTGEGTTPVMLLQDNFDGGPTFDPAVWGSVAGNAVLSSAYTYSGANAVDLSYNTGLMTSVAIDTSHCTALTWSF